MAILITEELKELLDVSDSVTFITYTKEESDECVRLLQEEQFKVVVPNLDSLELSGKTKYATISIDHFNWTSPYDPYQYQDDKNGFDIVIGGKVDEKNISRETIVVPVPSDDDVDKVVQQLKNDGYTVFSPTQTGLSPSTEKVTVTGETK